MKVVRTIKVPEHKRDDVIYKCDSCGKELKDTSWGKMKSCASCKQDVCYDCAIKTDYWYLENGDWAGDYPDYYCPKCWKIGEFYVEQIKACRKKEDELFQAWHAVAKEACPKQVEETG